MIKRKTFIKISIAVIIILLFTAIVILWNSMIEVNSYKITGKNLSDEFNGYKIAQISDFHNRKKYDSILEKVREESPDIICITGDFIDSRKTNTDISLSFAKELVKIAPCYYVMGNHESRLTNVYPDFEAALKEIGVCVLRNEKAELEKNGAKITLIGLDDPRLRSNTKGIEYASEVVREELSTVEREGYVIVMCHRPEVFNEYVSAGIDVALTGHAHGGQANLPFIGGVIAPNQGFFPKYVKGVYKKDNTSMVVSRGLGNSLCPVRFNNPPEVVIVQLFASE